MHYLFLQATPLFPHGVTIVCWLSCFDGVSQFLFTPALLRTHSFVFFAVHETRRIFLSPFISKASRRVSSFFLSVQLLQTYVYTGHTSASLVVSSLKSVCCDFSIFYAVMPRSPALCLTWYGIPSYAVTAISQTHYSFIDRETVME